MRTVTLSFDSDVAARRANFYAMLHGVVTDDADVADGYLDVIISADEHGVRQFQKIRGNGEVVSVIDEPINLGEDRTSKFAQRVAEMIATLPSDWQEKINA